jgi:hypothetical protein
MSGITGSRCGLWSKVDVACIIATCVNRGVGVAYGKSWSRCKLVGNCGVGVMEEVWLVGNHGGRCDLWEIIEKCSLREEIMACV